MSTRSSFGRSRTLLLLRSFFVTLIYSFLLSDVNSFAPINSRPLLRIQKGIGSADNTATALHEKKAWTTSLFPVLPTAVLTVPSEQGPTTVNQVVPPPDRGFAQNAYKQALAGGIGVLVGLAVAGFKISIETIREFCYLDLVNYLPMYLIPALGGVGVAVLASVGDGDFPPGVQGVVGETDKDAMNRNEKGKLQELGDSFRKAWAAIFTLGTGCSLGPEGPGVEIGIAVSRLGTLVWPQQFDAITDNELVNTAARVRRNRLFLACGAAAGVSSGFNAPLSGVSNELVSIIHCATIQTYANHVHCRLS